MNMVVDLIVECRSNQYTDEHSKNDEHRNRRGAKPKYETTANGGEVKWKHKMLHRLSERTYPPPRIVWISFFCPSVSIFFRKFLIYTSITFENVSKSLPHTCSIIIERVTTSS